MKLVKVAGVTGLLILLFSLLPTQAIEVRSTDSQLAQILMFERDLRERLQRALADLLGPVKFIVEVDAQLEFTPAVRRETVYKKMEKPEVTPPKPEGEVEEELEEGALEVLPGFPTIPIKEKAEAPALGEQPGVISQTISSTSLPIPTVSELDITVILEDGVPAEWIEQVRDIVSVIAQIDPDRGDQLRILTASFPKETVSVAETAPPTEGPVETGEGPAVATARVVEPESRFPLPWLIALALGVVLVVLLFVILIRVAKRLGPVPEKVEMPLPPAPEEAAPPRPSGVEREVLRSELKAARQAAVTLAVTNPEVASSVIQEWLAQEQEGGE